MADTDKRPDPLAPKPQAGVGSPLAPEKERSARDAGVQGREIGTDKDPRANQEISDGRDEEEATVNVNLAEWNEKHPYPPAGPGSWMFRFSGPEDKDKEAETRSYSSDYGFAQQQAASEAREEGVETLTLDPASPHG